MSIKTISFPLNDKKSKPKQLVTSHLSLNHQRQHRAQVLHHTHSLTQSSSISDAFRPLVSTPNTGSSQPRPYHLNDFANNHLFLAKRKIAEAFQGPSNRNVQSKNDLLYLFDRPESKSKYRNVTKSKRRDNSMIKSSSNDHHIHLSVLNLRVSPPYSLTQNRQQLSSGLIRPFELWSGVKNLSST
ncbi:unnamed protein product [Adineta ricciae]|uniref:Uncharacterized protein n=1 Tax=Adineta ricciae TaxID=249248 RepID=A0A813Q7B5_ADIRI|nr:unnamed protein product [Adineta ricciae]CAF1165243.1 unnamed protein product [Adineta ricciae]